MAASLLMAIGRAVYCVALTSWPDLVAAWLLPTVVLMVAVLAFLQWRGGSLPTSARALERRALWIAFGLAFVPVTVHRLLLPEGFSPWLLLLGAVPALPFAVLAWRVSRS